MELKKKDYNKIVSYGEKYGVEIDLIDYNSLWDNTLTSEENLSYIRQVIEDMSINRIDGDMKTHKTSLKSEKEAQERLEIESIKQIEKKTEEEFNKSLEELKNTTTETIKEYDIPREYIKSVVKGFNKSFIFIGNAGLGKTYLTRQILMKEKANFVENRGVNSPMALYQFLYNNNQEDLILVFDDTAGLINNPNAYSILLNVLWEGFAEWNSTSEKLKVPKKFLFKGKIIFITNKLDGDNAEVLKSRCLVYDLKLKHNEIIKMMSLIAKQEHNSLSKEERFEIVDFIKESTNESTTNLDLRTQQKAERLYLYDKQSWKELLMPLLEKSDEMELLMTCLSTCSTITQAEQTWCYETGKSRRTFYHLKKVLNKIN